MSINECCAYVNVCVCMCVSKKRPGFQQNSNFRQLFPPFQASSARYRVVLEPEEYCSFINKWTVPLFCSKFTNGHSTGCEATMATKQHNQGKNPCLCVCACVRACVRPYMRACVRVSYRSKGVRDNSRRFTHISKNKITTAAVGPFITVDHRHPST